MARHGSMGTSLCDLGYCYAGIDDGWQECNSGPGGVGFHNLTGYPQVNRGRFPDLKALTAKARALGLAPGWYGNNDGCEEKRPACALQPNGSDICFAGDVAATIDYGFESVKYDGGGVERNISHFALLYNRTRLHGHRSEARGARVPGKTGYARPVPPHS
jgi:hypothetical protein